ncbi:MAG: metallophosphoesterase [Phaeodactylibacter sp.]|nr:metallophosphoesterase [Phaeodactylibacter sp.]MCB9273970.1 metallophosphoesterase [Lewinellaceae bacterium]
MRLAIIITVILLFDLYAFQAFRTLAQNWQPTLRYLTYGIYWLIPLAMLSWMLWSGPGHHLNKYASTLLRTIFFIVYISKLLVVGFLFIDDLRRATSFVYNQFAGSKNYDPSRSRFLTQMGLLIGAVPFVSLVWGVVRNPYRYTLFKETVKIPNLPAALNGLRIVQISDIHTGSFLLKEPVRNSITLVNEQKPDLVFFTGDLVNALAKEAEPFLDVFDKVQSKYGVYSILGNHDYGDYHEWENPEDKKANFELLKSMHQQLGWDLMLNENRMLDINGEQLAVIGVENYSSHPRFPKYGDLKKAYEGTSDASLKLLLSHDPSHWTDQVIKDFKDIAITFSGHTHGMQFGVEIPGWIKWSPIKYVYKQWAGLYKQGQQYLYVNRGLGYLGYPGRVGILPEITLVELRTA